MIHIITKSVIEALEALFTPIKFISLYEPRYSDYKDMMNYNHLRDHINLKSEVMPKNTTFILYQRTNLEVSTNSPRSHHGKLMRESYYSIDSKRNIDPTYTDQYFINKLVFVEYQLSIKVISTSVEALDIIQIRSLTTLVSDNVAWTTLDINGIEVKIKSHYQIDRSLSGINLTDNTSLGSVWETEFTINVRTPVFDIDTTQVKFYTNSAVNIIELDRGVMR